MRRHGPVIAHCTDSEEFPVCLLELYIVNLIVSFFGVICYAES